jgi:hypothetical protein
VQDEMQQLKATAGALREQLELSRLEMANALQAERLNASGETAQLRATIQEMRERMEALGKKGN